MSYSYPLSWFKRVTRKEDINKYDEEKDKVKFKFEEYNANPNNRMINDCVARAISRATGISWENVILDLTKLGVKNGYLFNYYENYKNYLNQLGWKENNSKETKVTIKYFVENIAEENKSYIIRLKGHLTYVEGYTLIDTWNCSYKKIVRLWEKE